MGCGATEGWFFAMSWNDIFVKKKTEGAGESDNTTVLASAAPEKETVPEGATEKALGDDAAASALCEAVVRMRVTCPGDIGKAALYLALSDSISEEHHIKDALASCGWQSVATEVGGLSGELSMKVSRALVGAALNSGVVRKNTSEMHALMHAAQEAFESFIPMGLLQTSLGAKIAIVRNSQWLAVAVAGDTAFHSVAHHQRAGLGVMHI